MSIPSESLDSRHKVFIMIDGPGHDGTRLHLEEGITSFGRLPSNDVVLLGDLVSRNHARILYFNGKAAIQDLNSHNGCWINGEKITNQSIQHRDALRIGNFRLTVVETEISKDPDSRPTVPWINAPVDTETAQQLRHRTATSEPNLGSSDRDLPDDVDIRHPDQSVSISLSNLGTDDSSRSSEQLGQSLLLAMLKATDAFTQATSLSDYCSRILTIVVDEIRVSAGGFYRMTPGQTIPELSCTQGSAIEAGGQLEASTSVLSWAVAKRYTIFSKDISDDIRFNHHESVLGTVKNMRALVCAPVMTRDDVYGALYVSRNADDRFSEREIDVIEAIARLFASGIQHFDRRQQDIKEQVDRANIARFHGPNVVDHVIEDVVDRSSMDARVATVCSANLCGLSALAEHLDTQTVSEFLNAYHEQMANIVFAYHGTLTKRQAGELSAVFGAPYSTGRDAHNALSAAQKMRQVVADMTQQYPDFSALSLRVGLSTGRVLVGFMGNESRKDYTVIGRSVDVADRLRRSATPNAIIFSAETENAVQDNFTTVRLAPSSSVTDIRGIERFSVPEE